MALWFSASSVSSSLQQRWTLSDGQVAWLTISVQVGFVLGTLFSAITNLADRVPVHRLLAIAALLGAVCNAAIPLGVSDQAGKTTGGFAVVVVLRLLTGVTLAGVYPPGMKLMATWFREGRGFAIGVLVGALTIGSGTPHLLRLLPLNNVSSDDWAPWRSIMVVSSLMAATASIISFLALRTGPFLTKAKSFQWSYFIKIWADKPLRRANFGYLGHMLELYAMWTAVPMLLKISLNAAHVSIAWQSIACFGVFAMGTVGCVTAGILADRVGRTRVAIVSLVLSGGCALFAGIPGRLPSPAGRCLLDLGLFSDR